jgi:arsenate reductase
MAEGFARHLKSHMLNAYSAGIETHGLNPNAVKVMAEYNIDISNHKSQTPAELGVNFDYVITVCGHAHEHCPLFTGDAKIIHVGFEDPPKLAADLTDEEAKLDCYRRVRDQIRDFIKTLPGALTD